MLIFFLRNPFHLRGKNEKAVFFASGYMSYIYDFFISGFTCKNVSFPTALNKLLFSWKWIAIFLSVFCTIFTVNFWKIYILCRQMHFQNETIVYFPTVKFTLLKHRLTFHRWFKIKTTHLTFCWHINICQMVRYGKTA